MIRRIPVQELNTPKKRAAAFPSFLLKRVVALQKASLESREKDDPQLALAQMHMCEPFLTTLKELKKYTKKYIEDYVCRQLNAIYAQVKRGGLSENEYIVLRHREFSYCKMLEFLFIENYPPILKPLDEIR